MVRRNVPLADQVIAEVLSEIDAGKLARSDGMLPSEAELVQRFQVSRATIREALAKLEHGGIVVRRQGKGTYVNNPIDDNPAAIHYWLDDTASFSELIRSSGHVPECRIVQSSLVPAGPLASLLSIAPSEQVLSVEKVFVSDGEPIISCQNVVPFDIIDSQYRDVALQGDSCLDSIYQFLEAQCHRKVSHQKSQVYAVAAGEVLAARLGCPPGSPLLKAQEVGYGEDMRPIFCGLNHFRSDLVSFVQVRRPAIMIAPRGSAELSA